MELDKSSVMGFSELSVRLRTASEKIDPKLKKKNRTFRTSLPFDTNSEYSLEQILASKFITELTKPYLLNTVSRDQTVPKHVQTINELLNEQDTYTEYPDLFSAALTEQLISFCNILYPHIEQENTQPPDIRASLQEYIESVVHRIRLPNPLTHSNGNVNKDKLPGFGRKVLTLRSRNSNTFFVTVKTYTGYDEHHATLLQEKTADTFPFVHSGFDTQTIIQLTLPDINKDDYIPLPQCNITGIYNRADPQLKNSNPISVHTKIEQRDIELTDCLIINSLGFVCLDTQKVKEKIGKTKHIQLTIAYPDYPNVIDTSQQGLPALSEEEQEKKMRLYPTEIQQVIIFLKTVQKEQKYNTLVNKQIFHYLSSYIGDMYLTYGANSGLRKKPNGFTRTNEILEKRKAVCQGSNLLLGELMRFFLKPGDVIQYVEGYPITTNNYSEGTATTNDLHLKVLYIPSQETETPTYYDATPFTRKQRLEHRKKNRTIMQELALWEDIENKNFSEVHITKEQTNDSLVEIDYCLTDFYYTLCEWNIRYNHSAFQQFEKQLKKLSTTGLISFLSDYYNLDYVTQERIMAQYTTWCSIFSYKIPHPARYPTISPPDVEQAIDHDWFDSDIDIRREKLLQSEHIHRSFVVAVQQNKHMLHDVAIFFNTITAEYKMKILAILKKHKDILPASPVNFLREMQFLKFFEPPLQKNLISDSLLHRSRNIRRPGFFTHDGNQDMHKYLMDELKKSGWLAYMEENLQIFDESLPQCPKRIRYRQQLVSSLTLWKQALENDQISQTDTQSVHESTCIDPDKILGFLSTRLNQEMHTDHSSE